MYVGDIPNHRQELAQLLLGFGGEVGHRKQFLQHRPFAVAHREEDVVHRVLAVIGVGLREEVLEQHVALQMEAAFGRAFHDDIRPLGLDVDAAEGCVFARIDAVAAHQMRQDGAHGDTGGLHVAEVGHYRLVGAVHKGLGATHETAPGQGLAQAPLSAAQAVLLAQLYALAVVQDDVHHAVLALIAGALPLEFAADEAFQHQLPGCLGTDEVAKRFVAEHAVQQLLLVFRHLDEARGFVAQEGRLRMELVGVHLQTREVGGQQRRHVLLEHEFLVCKALWIDKFGQQVHIDALQRMHQHLGHQQGGAYAAVVALTCLCHKGLKPLFVVAAVARPRGYHPEAGRPWRFCSSWSALRRTP